MSDFVSNPDKPTSKKDAGPNGPSPLPPRPSPTGSSLRHATDSSSLPDDHGSVVQGKGRSIANESRNVSWSEQTEVIKTIDESVGRKNKDSNEMEIKFTTEPRMTRDLSSHSFSSPFLNDDNDEELDRFLKSEIPPSEQNKLPELAQQNIKLEDVLNAYPVEGVAETTVLNSLEARHHHATSSSSLLSNVTAKGAAVFSNVGSNTPAESTQHVTNFNVNVTSSVADENLNLSKNEMGLPNHNRNFSNVSISTKGSFRGDSIHVMSTRSSSKDGTGMQKDINPGFLSRMTTEGTSSRPMKNPEPLGHKRVHTMEHTLATLFDAIHGMHEVNDGNSVTTVRHAPAEAQIGSKDASGGAAGTLAHNANLIYRGKDLGDKSTRHIQTRSEDLSLQHANHWAKLRAAVDSHSIESLEYLKKNDSLIDEETGRKTVGLEYHEDGKQNNLNSPNSLHQPLENDANKKGHKRKNRMMRRVTEKVKQTSGVLSDFCTFTVERKDRFFLYMRLLFTLICPALAVSFFLFYAVDNPPTGRIDMDASSAAGVLVNHLGQNIDPLKASASWWILFLCVRQVFTFSLAKVMEVLIIDFLCLNTRVVVTFFGNLMTLLIVQAKGWPFLLLMWALFNFGLLHGSSLFVKHWLFWQNEIGIFNEENPGGDISTNSWHRTILIVSIIMSVLVALKRLWMGLFLGKKTYANYAEDLAKVMNKILTLCQIAALARDFQWEAENLTKSQPITRNCGMSVERFKGLVQSTSRLDDEKDEFNGPSNPRSVTYESEPVSFLVDPNEVDRQTGSLSHSQKIKLVELLGAWEGPEEERSVEEDPSISAILQFKHSLSLIDNRYMFSIAWGDVSWRDRMVISSQEVYTRLLLSTQDTGILAFDILAQIAMNKDGNLDQHKLKELIHMFRPDRDGTLTLLQFVKSVDNVYKEAKLLRASVSNSEKIDRTFERAINVVFYAITICVILSQLGYDPLKLFLSLSSIIVAFAFMIGSAASKIFEGFLFILIRRPFDVGDRIHVSGINTDTNADGSPGWIVKDVDLFTTTVIFGNTNEKATLANSSLAQSRIINMARSKKATIAVSNKFSTEVPYEKVVVFEAALREFVQARPREWGRFIAFRAKAVMSDLGYVDYVVLLEHRDSWQNIGAVLMSKAQVSSFCLELAKKLGMRYKCPPLPVDLTINSDNRLTTEDGNRSTTQDGNRSTTQDGNMNVVSHTENNQSLIDEVAAMFAIAP